MASSPVKLPIVEERLFEHMLIDLVQLCCIDVASAIMPCVFTKPILAPDIEDISCFQVSRLRQLNNDRSFMHYAFLDF